MPIFDFICPVCGRKEIDKVCKDKDSAPTCCNGVMTHYYSKGRVLIKEKYPLWIDRIDEIHREQEASGQERLTMPHPKELWQIRHKTVF